jgi:hypothetical protein
MISERSDESWRQGAEGVLTEEEERSDPKDIDGITRRVRLHHSHSYPRPRISPGIRVENDRGVDLRRY